MRSVFRQAFFAVAILIASTFGPYVASVSTACSAIMLQLAGQPVMVRNYDWHIGNALVMLNQPGIVKRALSFDNPAEWTSQFGSATVNQYGRELPCDGINEAGLAIAVLWLDASEYPASDERPSVNTAQWVQYQLDTAKTVADVIASDNIIRITPYGGAKVHYFVSDATGDCAVVEFLKGRMVAHRDTTLPFKQITNNTCKLSSEYLAKFHGFGGERAVPSDTASLNRYVRLASAATEIVPDRENLPTIAFDTIHKVRQRSTRWQIAYDLPEKKMFFRTQKNSALREIDLTQCNFDSAKPVMILDIDAPLKGDVIAEFREYTREANKRLVERSVAATEFTRNLPSSLVQLVISYPDVSCRPASTPVEAAR